MVSLPGTSSSVFITTLRVISNHMHYPNAFVIAAVTLQLQDQ
jgi:hypothetical protein